MIVDTSALVSVAFGEPDANWIVSILLRDPMPRISAANLLETFIVIHRRRGAEADTVIEETVRPAGLMVEPVTEAQVEIARDAYRRYGKGSGHPARLNYGDCFAYALARYLDEPLLFVGNDFPHTDILWAS